MHDDRMENRAFRVTYEDANGEVKTAIVDAFNPGDMLLSIRLRGGRVIKYVEVES